MSAKAFFIKVNAEFDKLKKRELAQIIKVEAQKQWNTHFERGGFEDVGFTPWQSRKDNRDSNRGLLVKSGTLRKHARRGEIVPEGVRFNFPLAYERAHNFGEKIDTTVNVKSHTRKGITVKAHTRRVNFIMPKRQFIGESKALDKRIENKVIKTIATRLNT